ncbi:sensor domain-containing diguanylate cyclase [Delftia sp. PS-11]|uniref:sensor domain-containing diguanylate cyclase n=1 Tax=Delftia sp. PS-11 TaxID=2767222 RepID=UPI002458A0A1|nr:sensor domain-containing diguanylate cyclase [Delftia sp. PS-11]
MNTQNPKKPTHWQRLGLRTQLTLVFGSLLIAVTVLLSLAFGELLRWRMQREASASLHAVASNAAKLLADGLFSRARMVEVLARSEELWGEGFDAPGVDALLNRTHALVPFALWVGVADAEGMVRSAAGNLLRGRSISDQPWFEPGLQQTYVGETHTSGPLAEVLQPAVGSAQIGHSLDFAAPIRRNELTQGVLCMHSSWDWVYETLETLLPADARRRQISLFIFDRQGRLVHAPDVLADRFSGLEQHLPKGSMAAPGMQAHIALWEDSAQPFLTATVPLQARSHATDMGWHIVARQPEDSAHAPARLAMYKVLAGGLAAALLAASVAWLAARRLSQDLKQLASAASGFDGQCTAANIPLLGSSHEVHELALALRSSITQLQAANEAMEREVRERTQQLRQANAELEHLARSDPLTGLLNRRGVEAQMEFAMALARRSGRPLSVLAIDVDYFKRINDHHGHDTGDEVLRILARVLRHRLRESDVLARMGGEEFLVLLPDTAAEAAVLIAEQLRKLLAGTPMPHGETVTASMGVATLRGIADSSAAMLRRSDEALYAAKGAGRNNVQLQL